MEGEKTGAHRMFGRKKIVAIFVMAIVLLGVGGVLLYTHAHRNPFPSAIRSQTKFPLYYPSKLPQGWQVDQTSYTVNDGIFFYRITGPSTNLVVTTQSPPPGFDLQAFYKQQMKGATFFDAADGDGAIGKVNGKIVGSMFGGNSWVLLSPTSSNITQHELRQIIMALHS